MEGFEWLVDSLKQAPGIAVALAVIVLGFKAATLLGFRVIDNSAATSKEWADRFLTTHEKLAGSMTEFSASIGKALDADRETAIVLAAVSRQIDEMKQDTRRSLTALQMKIDDARAAAECRQCPLGEGEQK